MYDNYSKIEYSRLYVKVQRQAGRGFSDPT